MSRVKKILPLAVLGGIATWWVKRKKSPPAEGAFRDVTSEFGDDLTGGQEAGEPSGFQGGESQDGDAD